MIPAPERRARTLADLDAAPAAAGPRLAPGPDAADARVDLKLLVAAAHAALARADARDRDAAARARARLAGLDGPDLWAGTVQDGTARGFVSRLEEVVALCPPAPAWPTPPRDDEAEALGRIKVTTWPELRRRRDLLVASRGPRVRWSRKGGLLLVDRKADLQVADFLTFDWQTCGGTLDRLELDPGERPRLHGTGHLRPVLHVQGERGDWLTLEGRLGRRSPGFPLRLTLAGRPDEDRLYVRLEIENRHDDHRLRVRLRGLPEPLPVVSHGTPAWTRVVHRGQTSHAATLVRACGWLDVGGERVAVPGAQCRGTLVHHWFLDASARA